MTVLVLEQIHTYYGHSHILQGLSLRVGEGEVVALLGRNGVGKTTTIRSVIGFNPPRQGQILLRGENVAGQPAHRIAQMGVGLVPQGRGIFPTLTVRENLTLAARQGASGEWAFDKVLGLFPALGQRLKNMGGQLSGGEQQMLAIARALMTNPSLLLLDEPSEGLAPMLVAEIGRVISQLRAEKLSILLVEQNLGLALDTADRVVVMSKGQAVFEGSSLQLQAQPKVMQRYLGV